MTALGPFLFGAPLALLALAGLPLLWWILRATPPPPKRAELPSLRLLEGVTTREETPSRTPWWIWLIRTLAALAAIIGLSQPVYAPNAKSNSPEAAGPLLVVIDNGWAAAPRWSELVNAAGATLDSGDRDGAVHLLLTAPQALNVDPAERLSRADAQRRLSSLRPQSWGADRADALARLQASGFKPARIFWASDGLGNGDGAAFATALAAAAPLTVFAAPPKSAAAITALTSQTDAVSVTVARADLAGEDRGFVSALTLDGSALATAELVFKDGSGEATADFVLPAAALSRVARFAVTGQQGAGTVWLWDSADRSRRVGLVDVGAAAQPLLSDMHYVRKALEPFAAISEGSVESLVSTAPDAIIMTDAGQISADDTKRLTEWIDAGGALIRFAGPLLAAQGDTLLPVGLRRSSRAFGGALAWEEPQAIAAFAETSPFQGLPVPPDVRIRQQVLARPEPELSAKTWARLADGSPLVTAETRGAGTVILFHITAGPEWADLAYSETFEQMLRRAIAAGRGETVSDTEGAYAPERMLDGFGRFTSPGPNAAPLKAADFATTRASEVHPPGLYKGPAGTRALNIGARAKTDLMTAWPLSARLLGDAETRSLRFAGPLIGLAAGLLVLDLLIALWIAGRLPRFGAAAAALMLSAAMLSLSPQASAQEEDFFGCDDPQAAEIVPLGTASGAKADEISAALTLRFGYVKTGNRALDERTRAGLVGLSTLLTVRTAVEPGEPKALDLERDALALHPLIYFNVPERTTPLSEAAIRQLNAYIRVGGALLIDTRAGGAGAAQSDPERLQTLLRGLDIPALQTVPDNHVLSRSYYLIDDFPGRFADRRLWVEQTGAPGTVRGDGVARIFVGDADWAGAWAVNENGRDLFAVDGGPVQREMAGRFGVNLVMYVLTGSYKDDQVHLPALLERLGESGDGDPGETDTETGTEE
jgi:Domain of unknown function (DUF4159)/Aerotolerance regulator N-terminal